VYVSIVTAIVAPKANTFIKHGAILEGCHCPDILQRLFGLTRAKNQI